MYLPDSELRQRAFDVLNGVGDASLGEWEEKGASAFHLRRRLCNEEALLVGSVVDVRGTQEASRRVWAVRKWVLAAGPFAIDVAAEEVGREGGATVNLADLQGLLPEAAVEPTCSGELVIYTGLRIDSRTDDPDAPLVSFECPSCNEQDQDDNPHDCADPWHNAERRSRRAIAERHMRHYQSCDCLADSHECCIEECPCHSSSAAPS